jgi:Na+/H+-translocating membrane pyrophosphatase
MDTTLLLVIAASLLAVAYAVVQTSVLLKAPAGNERMGEIARAIQEGPRPTFAASTSPSRWWGSSS